MKFVLKSFKGRYNVSWKKYFRLAPTDGSLSPINGSRSKQHKAIDTMGYGNYTIPLPEIYTGVANRIERYQTYLAMNGDPEVSAALDILAEFSTQINAESNLAFQFHFNEQPTETEAKILKKQLQNWYNLNELDKRIFKIFRNVLMYGDQIFLRDPETFKMFYVEMSDVVKVIVNESDGKKPEQYVLRNLNPNFENLSVTAVPADNLYYTAPNTGQQNGSAVTYNVPNNPYSTGSRFAHGLNEHAIDAQHIVHLSLTEGLDPNWPFGNSILELIFKVYKQKELLEDAIIIYRIQRAPERRVFYIDVGEMPSHLAMAFVDRVKNEIHQRRIPSKFGGQDMTDSTYSPLSINQDFFFPQTCLSLDTEIKLLDGRDLSLGNLITEYETGKQNWVYSVDPATQLVEPGEIVWAGITRKNTRVMRVTLDSQEYIDVTPDHRFIMRDGSEKEAQELQPDDSIMPLYFLDAKTGKHQGAANYLKYICPSNGKSKWVHTMVCPKNKPGRETEIHHIDINSHNNNPTNLVEMNTEDHRQLHKDLGSYHMQKAWADPVQRNKIVQGIRDYHANATDDDKKMMSDRGRKNGAKTKIHHKGDKSSFSILRRKYPEKMREAALRGLKKGNDAKRVKLTVEMAGRMVELYNEGHTRLDDQIKILKTDEKFQAAFRSANPDIKRDSNKPLNFCPSDDKIQKMIRLLGYNYWSHFKETYKFNHKVLSVQLLEQKIDTGDITIKSKNNCHNFALKVGIFVHNSTGRGSKVETLPSGQNLGEISDLTYFTNKMVRGLRIPSSYLPTGPDESAATFNDGRVGTALIQEFRFNQYCQRLQNLIVAVLDVEFKAYLKWIGVNIDTGIFQLKFNDPQNFAHYRESELDATKIGTFSQLEGYSYFSKRYLMKRYLGMSEDEIAENQTLWSEEHEDADYSMAEQPDLRNLGISPGGIESDLDNLGPTEDMEGETPDMEGEAPGVPGAGAGQVGGAGEVPGGAPPAPPPAGNV